MSKPRARKSAPRDGGPARIGAIRIGIGGWTYEPWRGQFYPRGLPHAQELTHASRRLTSIEINGTFYRTQTPATFAKWAREVPDGFVFAVKGPRAVVGRRTLAETAPAIARFLDSGVTELGDRLGPILWQLAPTKRFDADDLGAFLDLLPNRHAGVGLRHALEVRHDSFMVPGLIDMLRARGIAVVFVEHAVYPAIADVTADFVYVRLQTGQERLKAAYSAAALETWAGRFTAWAAGGVPDDLPQISPDRRAPHEPRDVFVYVIHEAKLRAPAAAEALIGRVGSLRSRAAAGPSSV